MPVFPWKKSKVTSESSPAKEESKPSNDLDLIKEHAAKIEDHDLGLSETVDRIARLEEDIEFLLAESGQESQYRTELSAYVADLRQEMADNRVAKKVFGSLSIIVAFGLLVTPVVLSYSTSELFKELPDAPKATLLASMIAGGIGILLTVTRSVFRNTSSRIADDLIPPQVKAVHDLVSRKD